jgi:hypothetical protein
MSPLRPENETKTGGPKPRLSRDEASEYLLGVHGVQVAPATLAKYATLGGGPRFCKFGRKPLYPRDELDTWAAAKLGAVVANTGEADERRRQAGAA